MYASLTRAPGPSFNVLTIAISARGNLLNQIDICSISSLSAQNSSYLLISWTRRQALQSPESCSAKTMPPSVESYWASSWAMTRTSSTRPGKGSPAAQPNPHKPMRPASPDPATSQQTIRQA
jgi:hypothetical protein